MDYQHRSGNILSVTKDRRVIFRPVWCGCLAVEWTRSQAAEVLWQNRRNITRKGS
jgi:hypothetical protein